MLLACLVVVAVAVAAVVVLSTCRAQAQLSTFVVAHFELCGMFGSSVNKWLFFLQVVVVIVAFVVGVVVVVATWLLLLICICDLFIRGKSNLSLNPCQ